jgi:hypothetical protein
MYEKQLERPERLEGQSTETEVIVEARREQDQ